MSGRRGAFTLIEILFAVLLFSLLVSVVYGSYIYCARTITRCQTGYGPFRDALRLQRMITRTLASASAVRQRNTKATFEGDEARLSFTTLNRQGYDPEHPCPLAYVRITADHDAGVTLYTHPTWFLLDKDDAESGAKTTFPTAHEMHLSYLDGRDYGHEWDAAKKGKLPRAVRFELRLSGEGSTELAWTFEVPLLVQPELPIVGGPGVPANGFPGGIQGLPGAGGVPGGALAPGNISGLPGQPGTSVLPGAPGLLPGAPAPVPGPASFVPAQPGQPTPTQEGQ